MTAPVDIVRTRVSETRAGVRYSYRIPRSHIFGLSFTSGDLDTFGHRVKICQQDVGKVPDCRDFLVTFEIPVVVVSGKVSVFKDDANPLDERLGEISVFSEPVQFLSKCASLTVVRDKWRDASVNCLAVTCGCFSPKLCHPRVFRAKKRTLHVRWNVWRYFGARCVRDCAQKTNSPNGFGKSRKGHICRDLWPTKFADRIAEFVQNFEIDKHQAFACAAAPDSLMRLSFRLLLKSWPFGDDRLIDFNESVCCQAMGACGRD